MTVSPQWLSAVSPNTVMFAMLPLVFLALINMALIMRRLRLVHLQTWNALGQPRIFERNVPALMAFIGLRGDFRKLGDPALNRQVYAHRVLTAALLLGFAVIVLLNLLGHK